MTFHKNQSSRDKIYAVKNSMHKTKEEIDQINKYLTRYEKKEFFNRKNRYEFSGLIPYKKTEYCSLLPSEIEERMRKIRMEIEEQQENKI